MVDYNAMALMQQMQATQQATDALKKGQTNSINALTGAYKTGRSDVTGAIPQQTGALNTGYETATGAIQGGLNNSLSALGQGATGATGAINTGYDAARSDIAGGVAAYDPYYNSGVNANTAYNNALGLNGAAGNDAARANFTASPGYQWAVDQASNNALRRASAMGMLASGNTADSLTRLGSNLANQEWDNYLNRIKGISDQGLTAAGARYQGAADSANLATNRGQNLASIEGDLGKSRANAYDAYGTRGADLATGLGSNLANVHGGSANTLAGLAQGFGQNQANVYTTTAGNTANALMQGSQLSSNLMNQQAQQQYANSQKPWIIGAGILGGASSAASAYLGNPANKLF